jgi:hypothetical protein
VKFVSFLHVMSRSSRSTDGTNPNGRWCPLSTPELSRYLSSIKVHCPYRISHIATNFNSILTHYHDDDRASSSEQIGTRCTPSPSALSRRDATRIFSSSQPDVVADSCASDNDNNNDEPPIAVRILVPRSGDSIFNDSDDGRRHSNDGRACDPRTRREHRWRRHQLRYPPTNELRSPFIKRYYRAIGKVPRRQPRSSRE